MLRVEFYYLLLVLCWGYALLKGGAPERIGATTIAIGSILSLAALSSPARSYRSVEIGIFLVDVVCLLVFLVLALRANRYWPLWVTALQAIGTAGHALRLVDPTMIRWGYAFALAFWSYPMLALIALGTWRHQRRARLGVDRSWSNSSGRSVRVPPPGPTS